MTLVKPIKIDNYLVVEGFQIGHSTEIFRCIDTKSDFFDDFQVLHKIHSNVRDVKKASHRMFREIKTLQSLSHRGIPRLIHSGKIKNSNYFTREYTWGKSLLQLFRQLRDHRKLMAPHQAVIIANGIARILEYAHRVHLDWDENNLVVHRNLNPRNIIISYEGEVRINGFGMAPLNISSTHLDKYDFRTIGYLAPEQTRDFFSDKRSDIFSVGAILYEMLTGMPAFLDKNARNVISRLRSGSYVSPDKIVPDIDPTLCAIINKCLSKNPDDRYETASELSREFEAYMIRTRPGYGKGNVSRLIKGLFINDVKNEIKVFYEQFYEWKGEGAQLLKAIPVLLYQRFNSMPREVTAPPTLEEEEKTREMIAHVDDDIEDNEETRLLGEDPDYYRDEVNPSFEKATKIGIIRKNQNALDTAVDDDGKTLPVLAEETKMLDDMEDIFADEPSTVSEDFDEFGDEETVLDDESHGRYKRRPTLYFKADDQLQKTHQEIIASRNTFNKPPARPSSPPPSLRQNRQPVRVKNSRINTKVVATAIIASVLGLGLFFLTIWILTNFVG
ncbi:MAG: serine/threonine protein kinase [Deltaproteobacteria bacterium]|nr:serine/threonine protein kinase [Deltaproteobacteria bacterium]